MKCLAIYWNVLSESYFARYKKQELLLSVLKTDFADTSKLPTHLQFILMPVSANAKVSYILEDSSSNHGYRPKVGLLKNTFRVTGLFMT